MCEHFVISKLNFLSIFLEQPAPLYGNQLEKLNYPIVNNLDFWLTIVRVVPRRYFSGKYRLPCRRAPALKRRTLFSFFHVTSRLKDMWWQIRTITLIQITSQFKYKSPEFVASIILLDINIINSILWLYSNCFKAIIRFDKFCILGTIMADNLTN